MKMISLFSGIGGIDLGFQRAGIETIIQVENNPFCIVILKKHWPTCKRYIDIYDTNLSLFREDFHARTPVKVTHTAKASMDIEPVEDGNRCTELYAKLDPNTSLWRTFQTSLDEDGGKSLVIFPRQGITYGGGLYLLKTLVSRLRVNAFTPLLLRPLASDGKRYNCSIKTLSKRYKGGKSNITTPEILAARFGVKLTPRFYEKIMGFPLGHTELPPWVTPVSPFSQK